MTTTTTTAERLAERRERRDRIAAETAAAADLRRISAAYGEDAAGSAFLAAVESGATTVAACVAAAETSTRSARSFRGTLDRAAARDHDRAIAAYGPTAAPPRERRADTIGRLIRQRYGDAAAAVVVDVLTDDTHLTATDRTAAIETAAGVHVAAVVAAILADGPTARPDHDPATCGRESCRRCARLRRTTDLTVGPLAGQMDGAHRRRPTRDVRPPSEQTTANAVRILRESHLTSMLDTAREHHATTVGATPAQVTDQTPLAVHLVDACTTAAPGRRGWAVTRPAAVRPQVWRTLLAAAGATVIGDRRHLTTDQGRRIAVDDVRSVAALMPWSGAADRPTAAIAMAYALAVVAPDPTDRLAAYRPSWRRRRAAADRRDQVTTTTDRTTAAATLAAPGRRLVAMPCGAAGAWVAAVAADPTAV